MISLVSILLFASIFALIITRSWINALKNIYFQKISFLNEVLTEENMGSYRLMRKFSLSNKYIFDDLPTLKSGFSKNKEYKTIIEEFERKEELARKINIASIITLIIGVIGFFILL